MPRETILRHSKHPISELEGKVVEAVFCRGKVILLDVGDFALTIQLGMSGNFSWDDRHTSVVLDIGRDLFFNDQRSFASWQVWEPDEVIDPISKLGPEVDSVEFTPDYLKQKILRRSIDIKPLLLDQSLVSGIGNMYASEILLRAGILPNVPANELTNRELELVCEKSKEVIREAHQYGSAMIQRINPSYRSGGGMWRRMRIYGRKTCGQCLGPSVHMKQKGRSTWYCPLCQGRILTEIP